MKKNLLLTTQKNQVFELVKKYELDPSNFSWTIAISKITQNLEVTKLLYIGTEFYFMFDFSGENHSAVYAPGKDKWEAIDRAIFWDDQLNSFEKWLGFLKREIEAPDLWSQIQKYKPTTYISSDNMIDNKDFTDFQANQIKEGLDKIKTYLLDNINDDLRTKENITIIERKIDYLSEALTRQGRFDWFHTCIGVLITISIEFSISPEKAKIIWGILKDTLSGIISLLPIP